MAIFEVRGGNKLKGEIVPQGAKNEALQILSAVLLTAQLIEINNIPDIIDVNLLIELLKEMNVKVEKTGSHNYRFQADDVNVEYLQSEDYFKKS
jgi:UDP-N-acetylglucosamine 1-carboxyvinyltransferase